MNCFHCYYLLSKVFETEDENIGIMGNYCNNFQGYPIFDEHYNFEIYRFCSLNCGLKHIITETQVKNSNSDLVKKLKNFFDFYQIDYKNSSLKQALPFERLKVFGGDLTYEEYRKDFICPSIDIIYECENSSYIEYQIDYEKIFEDISVNF